MRAVLDTGVFYRRELLEGFLASEIEVVVPAVAYAERVRQLRRDGRDVEEFDRALARGNFVVEPFGGEEALRIPALRDREWGEHARDAMIAAHVREGDLLWTTNPRDFLAIGLKPSQVRGV